MRDQIRHPLLAEFFAYWATLSGGRALPRRADGERVDFIVVGFVAADR